LGAMTILSGFRLSHAPHQLKVELAMTACLQALMRTISSTDETPCPETKKTGQEKVMFALAQPMSSEKT